MLRDLLMRDNNQRIILMLCMTLHEIQTLWATVLSWAPAVLYCNLYNAQMEATLF